MKIKKILITGSEGFVGKNLKYLLDGREDIAVLEHNRGNTDQELLDKLKATDYLIHLAGINRPVNHDEFEKVNFGLTKKILSMLEDEDKDIPIIFSSSTQVLEDNPYGKSKLKAEEILLDKQSKQDNNIYVLRLPGIFGQGCKPNYNSVVATFCNNIQKDIPIQIHEPKKVLQLVYIDDVIEYIDDLVHKLPNSISPLSPTFIHEISLEKLAQTILEFKEAEKSQVTAAISSPLVSALYKTYQSYRV
jgi:UDP-2-acetamido-2,6-beta-L-arabino-hexul-4-ose reductase